MGGCSLQSCMYLPSKNLNLCRSSSWPVAAWFLASVPARLLVFDFDLPHSAVAAPFIFIVFFWFVCKIQQKDWLYSNWVRNYIVLLILIQKSVFNTIDLFQFSFIPFYLRTLHKEFFQMASALKGKILAVIGDEDTVVGFLLGGVGELNKVGRFIRAFSPN